MKQNNLPKIYMQDWLKRKQCSRTEQSDTWYLNLANELYEQLEKEPRYAEQTHEFKTDTAVRLALYMHDAIQQEGGWCQFTARCKELYGSYLPFYTLTDSYYHDEINPEDVCLLLWMQENPADKIEMKNPLDAELIQTAGNLYKVLDALFEQAPIADQVSGQWVMDAEQLKVERTEVPGIEEGKELPQNVQLFLDGTGGNQLAFFSDPTALQFFFEKQLHWPREKAANLVEDDVRNIVAFANPKGILLAPDIATCIADPTNLFYNSKIAKSIGYQLFTMRGACPFDLLKYSVAQNKLDELALPFEGGHALLHNNWDFIARWYLDHYYEGR